MLLTQDDLLHYYPNYTGEGSFVARAFVANGAFPVSRVKITVYACLPDNVWKPYRIMFTNESGETDPLPLPAPDKSASAAPPLPGAALPFAVYRATAEKEGYGVMQVDSIPVFDGITSRQNFPLIPLSDPAGSVTAQSGDIITQREENNAAAEAQRFEEQRSDITNAANETESRASNETDGQRSDMLEEEVSDAEGRTSYNDQLAAFQNAASQQTSEQSIEQRTTQNPTQMFTQDMLQNIAQNIAQNYAKQLTPQEIEYLTQQAIQDITQNITLQNTSTDTTGTVAQSDILQTTTNNMEMQNTEESQNGMQNWTQYENEISNPQTDTEPINENESVNDQRNTQSSLLDPDDTSSAGATYENLLQSDRTSPEFPMP